MKRTTILPSLIALSLLGLGASIVACDPSTRRGDVANPGQEDQSQDDTASDDTLPSGSTDEDGDGYAAGEDCDDTDPGAWPGAEEIPYDGIDQDCDGYDLTDLDGDGWDAEEAGGEDCDDEDPAFSPDAEEIPYDGIDQDCDGYDLTDLDGDGYDSDEVGGSDCNDDDSSVNPYAEEDCDGSSDYDCDGDVGYDDDDCCSLSCSCSGGSLSAGLSCGTSSMSCSYSYDSYGRPSYISCSYSNGTSFGCSVNWNSLGQASGTCTTSYGGGDSCSFSC